MYNMYFYILLTTTYTIEFSENTFLICETLLNCWCVDNGDWDRHLDSQRTLYMRFIDFLVYVTERLLFSSLESYY